MRTHLNEQLKVRLTISLKFLCFLIFLSQKKKTDFLKFDTETGIKEYEKYKKLILLNLYSFCQSQIYLMTTQNIKAQDNQKCKKINEKE